jgi:two-component system chemotaxis sensor kinase CheA
MPASRSTTVTDRAAALRNRLLATFRIEADEHLRTIGAELQTLRRDPASAQSAAGLEVLLRVMHTLKGAARSVGLGDFEESCQRCEALLSDLIRSGASPTPRDLEVLQDASDALAGEIAGSLPGASPHEPAPAPAPQNETIRVEVGRLDHVVTLAEGLLSPKLASAERVRQARGLAEEIERIRMQFAANFELREELRSLHARARQLVTELRGDGRTLQTTVDDLYEEMRHVRMMPAASIFDAFPLMIRDLGRETGKEVDWELAGADLEIDRKVLELVKDPLIHLVRNAVDHGLEAPDVREAAGKPRRGRVRVTVAPSEGGRISIEVSDDGRGFAIDALREAAVRSRLTSADRVAALSDADVADLAFSAGVSTSPVITTISGHGRGLAIVRERIERVEGRISTGSAVGTGTVIRLEFPASIVTYRALLVGVHGSRYLLPLDAVERVFAAPRDDAAAFGNLGTILDLPPAGSNAEPVLTCVAVRSGERHGVVIVDEVIGEHEVVIKDLRPPLRRVRNVLAAGLMGTGELVLVLRPLDVLASIDLRPAVQERSPQPSTPRVRCILVVDDSMTTRAMERNLFEAAGYRVRVAADGAEAWEMLQTEDVDIVVSDVDMPRMNGFELTAKLRGDPKLVNIPVVLVSALETRADKEQGIRAGANAYVLKSGFNQANLLDIVRRLT